ncbi:FAD-binding oxidoreductase [Ruegeria sp. HKCCD7255]|uniref:FAD-binding oxidoreductase n=1 Tax=Ruegeria sp. HKCCD7255 TaxID=2683004 RepID=UPI001487D174|nr:FAD-binding oxidoreductase [Ruegeria sp. HKCCD7255]
MDVRNTSIEELKGKLTGTVMSVGDPQYDDARGVWNAMIDRKPAVIARCRNTEDVCRAVRFAGEQGLPIAIRGGGHNVAGHAVCDDGVMIDLSEMRGVTVDPDQKRAIVQGGALWRDVDSETQKHGLATPGGLISDTGVAGLTLSGGIGWLRAKHGLSIDCLKAAEVVTADGSVVRTNAEENPDLLWALKGGGGNFGVVVTFEFELFPIGPEVMFAAPIYPLSAGPEPIRFWRDFVSEHEGVIGSLCEFSTAAEGEDFPEEYWGQKVFTLACVYNGDATEGDKLLQPLRELGPMAADFSGRMNYVDVQQLFDELMPAGDFRCYWKARYLSELPDEMIDHAMADAGAAPSANSLSSLWNFGGAVSRVPSDATAFGDRSMGWMYSLDAVWLDSKEDAANIAWSRAGWEESAKWDHEGRIYLNFPGHGEDNLELTKRAFGPNYAKLAQIKAQYDPNNVFCFNQNISPAA